jgi:hypothetical protein
MSNDIASLAIFLPIGIMIIELFVYGLSVLWKWFIQIQD